MNAKCGIAILFLFIAMNLAPTSSAWAQSRKRTLDRHKKIEKVKWWQTDFVTSVGLFEYRYTELTNTIVKKEFRQPGSYETEERSRIGLSIEMAMEARLNSFWTVQFRSVFYQSLNSGEGDFYFKDFSQGKSYEIWINHNFYGLGINTYGRAFSIKLKKARYPEKASYLDIKFGMGFTGVIKMNNSKVVYLTPEPSAGDLQIQQDFNEALRPVQSFINIHCLSAIAFRNVFVRFDYALSGVDAIVTEEPNPRGIKNRMNSRDQLSIAVGIQFRISKNKWKKQ